jgi:hypothetical protein
MNWSATQYGRLNFHTETEFQPKQMIVIKDFLAYLSPNFLSKTAQEQL